MDPIIITIIIIIIIISCPPTGVQTPNRPAYIAYKEWQMFVS